MKKKPPLKKIYVSPSAKRGKVGYPNKYFYRLKRELGKYLDVLEADNKPCLAQGLVLFINSFKADIFLLSFVETIAFHKLAFIQYCLACLSLWIMKLRGKKIIFIFHNIHPHKGENFMSRSLTRLQMKYSDSIISHSHRAVQYAKDYLEEYALSKSSGKSSSKNDFSSASSKVMYLCHPILPFDFSKGEFVENAQPKVEANQDLNLKLNHKVNIPPKYKIEHDIFIWGDIMPYKGVLEFLENPLIKESGLDILIIGSSKDKLLGEAIADVIEKISSESIDNCHNDVSLKSFTDKKADKNSKSTILSFAKTSIDFQNRRADFAEIAEQCLKSTVVLFPYNTKSISGSGVLIDTIAMGGKPVGPNVGAFNDLAKDGLCYVYEDISDFIRELKSIKENGDEILPEINERSEKFIENNSWENFVKTILKSVCRDEQ